MFGLWNWPDNPAKFAPNLNTDWRKRDETMTWILISYDDVEVTLQGPSGRKGIQKINISEFQTNWVRA